ncbi:MAG: aryldialkylphosphatase [Gemmatimonadetes bacterium]|nr:aryldialkylphosphatase [Gemmatimonadota bacterium]
MAGHVQTVLGPIAPDALGPTLLHEHVLCDIRPPAWRGDGMRGYDIPLPERFAIDYGEVHAPGNLVLDQVDLAAAELAHLRADGGRSIVDLSCGGLHPDPRGLAEVSRRADVHIVMGCGWYVDDYQAPGNAGRTVESFATEMLGQLRDGAWGSEIRAGIIGEIGCQAPWTALERRVMEGAVLAMQESGAALTIHPGRHPDQPQEVADFLRGRGVPMSRVVMSHLDRTIFDDDRLFRLADTGIVLEFDLFGMETTYYKLADIDMPNDGMRVATLGRLKARGHLDQIAISQDICYRSRLSTLGGHGYGHLLRNVVPLMRRRGFSEADVQRILVETPARLLTIG